MYPLVTQPMMQCQPNRTELRSMDSYIQILCRFQKSKWKVPPLSLPCIKKSSEDPVYYSFATLNSTLGFTLQSNKTNGSYAPHAALVMVMSLESIPCIQWGENFFEVAFLFQYTFFSRDFFANINNCIEIPISILWKRRDLKIRMLHQKI